MTQPELNFTPVPEHRNAPRLTEWARRDSYCQKLAAFFLSRPGVWIPMWEVEAASCSAWRSRLPKVRRQFERENIGEIVWNGRNGPESKYILVPASWFAEAPRGDD